MPKPETYINRANLREWLELWEWTDASGQQHEGPNPPDDCRDRARHKPFSIKYLDAKTAHRHGEPHGDRCICTAVYPGGERLLKYVESGELRRVHDSLIYWVNGYKVR